MKIDPEIERIRAVRHRISEECGHDPKRLVEYYREVSRELRASGQFRFAEPAQKEAGVILREEPPRGDSKQQPR